METRKLMESCENAYREANAETAEYPAWNVIITTMNEITWAADVSVYRRSMGSLVLGLTIRIKSSNLHILISLYVT